MAIDVYVLRNGQRHGPYALETVRAGLSDGTFKSDDQAWHAGIDGWVPLHSLATGSYQYRCSACGPQQHLRCLGGSAQAVGCSFLYSSSPVCRLVYWAFL